MNKSDKTGFLSNLIKDFDKPFRIIAPGFLILIIYFWTDDLPNTILELNKVNNFLLVFSAISIGMIFYSIHRTIFSFIDFTCVKAPKGHYIQSVKYSFKTPLDRDSEKTFRIFNASIHLSMMFFEIMILRCWFDNPLKPKGIELFIIGLIISLAVKIVVTFLVNSIRLDKMKTIKGENVIVK